MGNPTHFTSRSLHPLAARRIPRTSASIRLMVFADRVEIISPGHLPDSRSTEVILRGAINRRNPTLTEHAVHILPYRGLGTGSPCALHDWPAIELIDDVAANQFRVVIQRPEAFAPEVTTEVALLQALTQQLARRELQTALKLKNHKRNHKRGRVHLSQPAAD